MKRKGVYAVAAILIAIVAVVAIYALASNSGSGSGNQLTFSNQPTFNYSYSTANASAVAADEVNFTFAMYNLMNNSGSQPSNLFFSPFSAFVAMAMAARGASGETAVQMYNGLHIPYNATAHNEDGGFASILSSLSGRNAGYSLSIADALWVEQTYPFRQSFLGTLKRYYNASAYPADFLNNADTVTNNINNWVANKTNNKIQNLISPGLLTPATKAVLINTIYFHGLWEHKFDIGMTQNQNFYVSQSRTESVPMMNQELNASYYQNSTLQALELDYNNSNITMLIILPENTFGLANVTKGLGASSLLGIEQNLDVVPVEVWLPRFNITETMDLSGLFTVLGMKDAFTPRLANFSGMANFSNLSPLERMLYISNVIQKAFVAVDENGTTAAAATAVVATAAVVVVSPPQPVVFRADHPFLFLIIDKRSGAILFIGSISDPAAAS